MEQAQDGWRRWCRALEETGVAALEETITDEAVDVAEGLRYLARVARVASFAGYENLDSHDPYWWTALDPHLKLGGDNPQGRYLAAPINGTDTFVVRGVLGTERWASVIVRRSAEGAASGRPVFGDALFLPDLEVGADGAFEIVVGAHQQSGNWLPTDEHSSQLLLRQFFGTPHDVVPMQVTIQNLSRPPAPPAPLTLDAAVAQLDHATLLFSFLVPMMLAELVTKAGSVNTFATDVGAPTSTSSGVPGGNAVTARFALARSQALVVRVTPPTPCAYWDAQVGNGWYESFDFRTRFSGLTCEQVEPHPDGSITLVVSEQDPGTVNWLETAGHREGHLALRWQLSDDLPLPDCTVVDVVDVPGVTGLSAVTPGEREEHRRRLRHSFDARFGFG